MKVKEKIYNLCTNIGMKFFREYWGNASLKATDRWIEYPWVLKNLPKPPCRVLDVGCAGSPFPLLDKALGYNSWGIDIRPYSFKNIFNFRQYDIVESIGWIKGYKGFFDVVTAISTIEHIYNRYTATKNIHKLLKPKGLFLMTVPYARQSRQTKFHFIHNKNSLIALLKDFDFDVELVDSPETNNLALENKIALIKAVKV